MKEKEKEKDSEKDRKTEREREKDRERECSQKIGSGTCNLYPVEFNVTVFIVDQI